jgi:hypothetical protein
MFPVLTQVSCQAALQKRDYVANDTDRSSNVEPLLRTSTVYTPHEPLSTYKSTMGLSSDMIDAILLANL